MEMVSPFPPKRLLCKYLPLAWPRTWLAPSVEGMPSEGYLERLCPQKVLIQFLCREGPGEDNRQAAQKGAQPSSGGVSPHSGCGEKSVHPEGFLSGSPWGGEGGGEKSSWEKDSCHTLCIGGVKVG